MKIKNVPDLTERQIANFWAKVDRRSPDECWLWKGAKLSTGYGSFGVGGKTKVYRAHRVAYSLSNPLESNKQVCHHCDVKLCCNPAHLYSGSQSQNIQDAYAKGLMNHPRGEGHPNAKLDEGGALIIRALAMMEWPRREIATLFDISQSTVNDIVYRRYWRHV